MASASTSGNDIPRGPGRPRIVEEHLPLVVTIDSKENVMQNSAGGTSDAMSLRIPNRLLFSWYQDNTGTNKYISLVNAVIVDKVVQLKPVSEELSRKIRQRACSVFATANKKSGRARMEFLSRNSIICFSPKYVVKVSELQGEIKGLEEQVEELAAT